MTEGEAGGRFPRLDVLRRAIMFTLGAAMLFIEVEFRAQARVWVIALALTLMGIVSVEQVLDWLARRR